MPKLITHLLNFSFKGQRQRRVVLLSLLGIIILPYLILGAINYDQSYGSGTDTVLSRRQALAKLSAVDLSERFDHIIDVGQALADQTSLEQLVAQDKWSEGIKVLEPAPQDFSYIDQVVLFSNDGVLQAVTPFSPNIVGNNFSYRDYLQGVSKTGKPYVSNVFSRGASPHYNVVVVAVPIKDNGQKSLGFLVMTIKVKVFAEWAKQVPVGPGGFVYFVDRAGNVVGHPGYQDQNSLISFSNELAVQKALRGQSGVEQDHGQHSAENDVVAYQPVAGYNWAAVVQQPAKTAFASRDTRLRQMAIFYGISEIFLIILGFVMYRFLKLLYLYQEKEKVFLESIGDGLLAIDSDWKITLWNPAATHITGFAAEYALGKPLREIVKFVRASDGTENVGFIEDTLRLGKARNMENHTDLIRKDGTRVPVADSSSPIFDQKGVVSGVIVVFRDVSKEYRIQQAKDDQQRFLDSVIENIPNMIFVKDAKNLEFVRFNHAGEKLLGISRAEMVGKSDRDFFPSEQADSFIQKDREVLNGKHIVDIPEETIQSKSNGTRILHTKKVPVFDDQGNPRYLLGISEDITDRMQLEHSRDEFFSIASHELRTPLTAIKGNMALIKEYYWDRIVDTDLREMISDVHESSGRLIDIVNDFLDTSRLEQKRMKYQLEAFDPIALAESVIKEYHVTSSRQMIDMGVKKPHHELPLVYADKNRSKQVLINLVGNSLKFTERGSVNIEFEQGHDFVKILIVDTGRGMSPEAQKLLFHKFEQTGMSPLTRDSVRGTGLGLYISKMITEQMHGHIQLESSETGVGTTFSFTLPIASAGQKAHGPTSEIGPLLSNYEESKDENKSHEEGQDGTNQ